MKRTQTARHLRATQRVTIGATDLSTTGTEINQLAGQGALAADFAKLHAITASAAELNKTDGLAASAYPVVAAEVTFTETAGSGVYTGSVSVPAGSTILDIKVRNTALWTADTSAAMIVGDATDPNGWFDAIDLLAADLLVGEEINFENLGGCEGAYLVAATGERAAAYNAAAVVITGEITAVDATSAGGAGRTRMVVVYATPTASAATKV